MTARIVRILAAAAAAVLLAGIGLSWWLAVRDANPAFARVLEETAHARSLHGQLVREGKTFEFWAETPGRLRRDNPDGTYQIASDGKLWRIDERANRATSGQSPYHRDGDRSELDLLALLELPAKPDGPSLADSRPVGETQRDGLDCLVYHLEVPAREGPIEIEALVNRRTHLLHSMQAKEQGKDGARPLAELRVLAYNEADPRREIRRPRHAHRGRPSRQGDGRARRRHRQAGDAPALDAGEHAPSRQARRLAAHRRSRRQRRRPAPRQAHARPPRPRHPRRGDPARSNPPARRRAGNHGPRRRHPGAARPGEAEDRRQGHAALSTRRGAARQGPARAALATGVQGQDERGIDRLAGRSCGRPQRAADGRPAQGHGGHPRPDRPHRHRGIVRQPHRRRTGRRVSLPAAARRVDCRLRHVDRRQTGRGRHRREAARPRDLRDHPAGEARSGLARMDGRQHLQGPRLSDLRPLREAHPDHLHASPAVQGRSLPLQLRSAK